MMMKICIFFFGFGPRHVLIDHAPTLNRRFIDYRMPLRSLKTEMLYEMSILIIGAKMAVFDVFGPRRAARRLGRATFFSFAIIFNHPKKHSLRVSALTRKFS